jgi:hypothetical protein
MTNDTAEQHAIMDQILFKSLTEALSQSPQEPLIPQLSPTSPEPIRSFSSSQQSPLPTPHLLLKKDIPLWIRMFTFSSYVLSFPVYVSMYSTTKMLFWLRLLSDVPQSNLSSPSVPFDS